MNGEDINPPENEPTTEQVADELTDGLAFAAVLDLTAPDSEQWHEMEWVSIFGF
jgi:hypothetical protein